MDIDQYRERLRALERQLDAQVGRDLANVRETSDDSQDPVDRSVVDEVRDEYFGLAQTDSEILAAVRAALQRIDDGTFGRCVMGGETIDEKRLDAVPWTPYCVQHQEQAEAAAGMRTPRA